MKINYLMTKDYRKEWGVLDAIRELVQNCMDNSHCKSTFEFNGRNELIITTHNYVLPTEVFALGESQKESKDSRGGFGEGFKLAMLVLTREGYGPLLYSGDKKFLTGFEDCGMSVPTFYMEPEACSSNHLHNVQDTVFVIRDLTDSDIGELKYKLPILAGDALPVPDYQDVLLLPDRPGEIFVGGLYVCTSKDFRYGYNFCPSLVKLGCDRQIADTHGLAWETSKYWAKQTIHKADLVLNLLTDLVPDVSSFHWHANKEQCKNITEAFVRRFGHVEIKKMGSSLGYGMSVGGSLYTAMTKSGYAHVANTWEEPGTPFKKLEEYFQANKKHMRSKAARNLTQILEEAKKWQRK